MRTGRGLAGAESLDEPIRVSLAGTVDRKAVALIAAERTCADRSILEGVELVQPPETAS
jgi:hypothetical protein